MDEKRLRQHRAINDEPITDGTKLSHNKPKRKYVKPGFVRYGTKHEWLLGIARMCEPHQKIYIADLEAAGLGANDLPLRDKEECLVCAGLWPDHYGKPRAVLMKKEKTR